MDALTSTPAVSISSPNLQIWDRIYEDKEDGWTREKVNEELLKFHDVLVNGKTGCLAILVPLCGKSRIMLMFAEKGHCVVGIEWSGVAVKQFFEENGLAYSTKSCRIGGIEMPVYTADDKAITIYCGDLFAFKEDNLGGFDCIFDRGSIGFFDFTDIVKRAMYAELMNSFTKPGGRIVLSFFDYHPEHSTVPFAITEEEVTTLYKEHFSPPQLLQEYNAKQVIEIYDMPEDSLSTFSRYSWKVVLLIKILA